MEKGSLPRIPVDENLDESDDFLTPTLDELQGPSLLYHQDGHPSYNTGLDLDPMDSSSSSPGSPISPTEPPAPPYVEIAPGSDDPVPDQVPEISGELPPDYTKLDTHPTSFVIVGNIIQTPAGPFYQISSLLNQRRFQISIRRLSPNDVKQLRDGPLAYNPSDTSYTITDYPLVQSSRALEITSTSRRHTLPGKIMTKSGLRSWKAIHHRANGRSDELFTVKTSMTAALMRKDVDAEWKDANEKVLAVEGTESTTRGNANLALKLTSSLEPTDRDALIVCWVAKILSAQEK